MRIDRITLIAVMATNDMTVNRLADITGVARSTISGMRGGKSVRRETVEKIAKALNVDPESLREGANNGSNDN